MHALLFCLPTQKEPIIMKQRHQKGSPKLSLMVHLGRKEAKVMSTLTQDADQSLKQLFIFQTCKPWKIYPWARPHRDILRLPNAPRSPFLIFLIRHCHALTSQGCMIFPSPFQLQYPSAVETVRIHLRIPNNPALNNERFAIWACISSNSRNH